MVCRCRSSVCVDLEQVKKYREKTWSLQGEDKRYVRAIFSLVALMLVRPQVMRILWDFDLHGTTFLSFLPSAEPNQLLIFADI